MPVKLVSPLPQNNRCGSFWRSVREYSQESETQFVHDQNSQCTHTTRTARKAEVGRSLGRIQACERTSQDQSPAHRHWQEEGKSRQGRRSWWKRRREGCRQSRLEGSRSSRKGRFQGCGQEVGSARHRDADFIRVPDTPAESAGRSLPENSHRAASATC